jgi:galactitol-specific phosphotransferase system IIC component
MMRPPLFLRLRFCGRRYRFGLWLPLFLIWPLFLVGALLLLPLVLLAAIILFPFGWSLTVLMFGPLLLRVLCALRGLQVDVSDGKEQVYISFR